MCYSIGPRSPSKSSFEFQPMSMAENSPRPPMSPFGKSPSLGSPLLVAKSGGKTAASPMQVSNKSGSDPLTSPLTVRALIGPVSPHDAAKIQQEWRKSSKTSKILRLADPHKGLERQGRNLARKYKTGLLEYWDFINTYADFTTNEGLTLLENHLASKIREFEEDDAKKIFDLENELAGLNLESNERSFTAILPDETPLQSMTSETSMLDYRNGNNLTNANLSNINEALDESSLSPLSNSFIWNRPRDTRHNDSSSLDDSSSELFNHGGVNNSLFDRRSPSLESFNGSFHSAASSLNDSMMTAEEGVIFYLEGLRPTLTDYQVFRALDDISIDSSKFPNVFSWLNVIGTVAEEERSKWKPLKKIPEKKSRNVEPGKKLIFED